MVFFQVYFARLWFEKPLSSLNSEFTQLHWNGFEEVAESTETEEFRDRTEKLYPF